MELNGDVSISYMFSNENALLTSEELRAITTMSPFRGSNNMQLFP